MEEARFARREVGKCRTREGEADEAVESVEDPATLSLR
jgi:hypothetical protein